ncbi:folylpolyglutamate synthase, mitochondrial-like isoform X1 [Limulus polyphemus]|uniref:Folylpolyglutamate synthase n=1 Tax=Limulus polyphemus TaxID=6850 RepID=A0ABM1SWN8_LIMPO|nr:folylpolyglutamate synthase, mitochondrial-like isoform X1 [Limulus polyphemus]
MPYPCLLNLVRLVGGTMVKHIVSPMQLTGRGAIHVPARVCSAYEEAISALNDLQSNAAVLEKARREKSSNAHKNILATAKWLEKLNISVGDLDELNIIHVSGTKGKGSTCAFTESILRHHGLKTGFYSSPHLIAARERIRINGEPLSKQTFASYFWDVYTKLQKKDGKEEEMPTYFKFLTVMAFYVFLHEKVDVAVIEVGVGGLYDCTNVIRKPTVVGVTSLGFDHIGVLGDSIEKIALQKAGIFKPNIPAFTVPQIEGALPVLHQRALEIGCSLHVVPPMETYEWSTYPVELGIPGAVQSINASLALQLTKMWLNQRSKYETEQLPIPDGTGKTPSLPADMENGYHFTPPLAIPFKVTSLFANGLQQCVWPGRFQVLKRGSTTYYLDGAHTGESMEACIRWFKEECANEEKRTRGSVFRVLLFNCTGERKAETLLAPLTNKCFDLAVFCPNKVFITKDCASDQSNFTVDPQQEMHQCEVNMKVWCHMLSSIREEKIAANPSTSEYHSSSIHANIDMDCVIFPCILDALCWLSQGRETTFQSELCEFKHIVPPAKLMEASQLQILVTGSLHLVGGVLAVIDPEISCQSKCVVNGV